MSDETTLLSCPFCGGEAHIIVSSDGYGVECWGELCAKNQLEEIPTEAEAIAAWNTRHVATCRITASSTDGLCSDNPRHYFELSCGHSFTMDRLEPPNYCEVCGAKVVG